MKKLFHYFLNYTSRYVYSLLKPLNKMLNGRNILKYFAFFCTCITREWGCIIVLAVPSSPTYRDSAVSY